MIDINEKILSARREGNKRGLKVYQLIKTEITRVIHSGRELNDTVELKTLEKMMKTYQDSIDIYEKAGRTDLAEEEKKELEIVKSLLPDMPSKEEVRNLINELCDAKGDTLGMKDIKEILGKVQEKYPTANGKLVSDIIKSRL